MAKNADKDDAAASAAPAPVASPEVLGLIDGLIQLCEILAAHIPQAAMSVGSLAGALRHRLGLIRG